jgi:hypothetical protein
VPGRGTFVAAVYRDHPDYGPGWAPQDE